MKTRKPNQTTAESVFNIEDPDPFGNQSSIINLRRLSPVFRSIRQYCPACHGFVAIEPLFSTMHYFSVSSALSVAISLVPSRLRGDKPIMQNKPNLPLAQTVTLAQIPHRLSLRLRTTRYDIRRRDPLRGFTLHAIRNTKSALPAAAAARPAPESPALCSPSLSA